MGPAGPHPAHGLQNNPHCGMGTGTVPDLVPKALSPLAAPQAGAGKGEEETFGWGRKGRAPYLGKKWSKSSFGEPFGIFCHSLQVWACLVFGFPVAKCPPFRSGLDPLRAASPSLLSGDWGGGHRRAKNRGEAGPREMRAVPCGTDPISIRHVPTWPVPHHGEHPTTAGAHFGALVLSPGPEGDTSTRSHSIAPVACRDTMASPGWAEEL